MSPNDPLPPELFWLGLTCLITTLMWVPYVLNRIAVNGMPASLGLDKSRTLEHAPWALRAKAAHANAVENLVIFAPVILLAHLTSSSTPLTAVAAMIYFLARVAHYIIYLLGIPVLRTLTFAVGWAAQLLILAHVFHVF